MIKEYCQSLPMHPTKILILLLCLTWAGFALPALAGEALVNSEADVDVTGKDAADARAEAMIKAETDALSNLLGKLTTPEQTHSIMSNMEIDKISGIVRGTEVLEEKISSNRYRARVMV